MTDPGPSPFDAVADYLADATGPARPELDELRRLLAREETWLAPDPGLARTVVERIAAESPTPIRRAARRPRLVRAAGGLAAAAAVVVAVAFVARDGGGDDGTLVALAGTELAPDAAATAMVCDTPSGVSIVLRTEGLAPAPAGFYYQAWLSGPLGSVAVGTFHVRGGDDEPVELWSGVDPARYPTLAVTLEPEDGDPASSGLRVLAGEVP